MKPIPYRDNNLYNQNFLNENRLCALRNHVTSAALDNPNGVPEYMNIVRLTRTFEIKGQSVSALDFITKNTMDPSYDEKAPCDTLDFGNGSATYTALQTAFHTEFNKDLPSLIDLIAAWKTTYSNEQERRNLELSFLKPTNIENVAYKFQEVFAYKNAPLWSYIQNSSGSVRTGQFMADPRLAKYMLESLMQCQPDSLLLSILSSIEEELTPKTPRETKSDKDKRQEACSTLSKVCDALQKYYNDSNQQANLSASFGDIANPDSAMGFLSPAAGLPGDILQKFGRLSGGEKAISLIGALVLGRAVGHNFPKINAGIKTAIVASLGAPMLAHLGTKFMYGRSYMEVRKIKALLGGNNSKNPQQVIARICGFSLEEAKTPGVVNSMEGFIDSIVGNEVFASLPFRDVIMTFAPRDSDTAVLISASSSSAVLGALTAYPQIKSSLELVIPQLINKYEAKDQNPYEKAKFHIALSSSRTWVEGMHFLMSNSAEIDNLLAQDDMETPVTAQPTIENRTKVVTDDTNVTIPQMGIDHRVEDHISAKRPEYLQTHINQKISSLSRLSGHYHSAYFREVNAHDDINGITNGINVTTDGTFIYASFQIANADLTEANLKALYEKVKSILPPRNSNPASLKLVFAGSDEDEDGNSTPLLAGFSWIREGQTPAYNYESDEIDDIHDQQLVSMDNNVFGNRVLRLYTNVFRGETEGNSDIFNILNEPGSIKLDQINKKLPKNVKITQGQLTLLQTSLTALKSFAPSVMNIVSLLFSSAPAQIVEVLTGRDPATVKVLSIYRLWSRFSTEGVSTERDRRVEVLNKNLDIARGVISSLNHVKTGHALDRIKASFEYYALYFTCYEIEEKEEYFVPPKTPEAFYKKKANLVSDSSTLNALSF